MYITTLSAVLAVLAQIVVWLPLVQQVLGSIPGGVVNFQPGARRCTFLIARFYITGLD